MDIDRYLYKSLFEIILQQKPIFRIGIRIVLFGIIKVISVIGSTKL